LTKVKIGSRTYVDSDELCLLQKENHGQSIPDKDKQKIDIGTGHRDTVTVSRQRYEDVLIELGKLRKQNEILLEERARQEDKLLALTQREKELDLAMARIRSGETRKSDKDRELATAKERIKQLEGELSRLQSQKQWWQK
jgi:hypothetical protein